MHPKWLYFRYKLFRYRQVEQEVAKRANVSTFLDLGCGDGEYLLRFRPLPINIFGLEVSLPRLEKARRQGLAVLQGTGASLPFPENSLDMIYIAHVLHHVPDYQKVLAEIKRCLTPDGYVFMIESVTDNPLLKLGRKIHPVWQGDALEWDWRYDELYAILEEAGFHIEEKDHFNLIFFLWEIFPLNFWPLELFTPIFICLDLILAKFFRRYSAHCYFVLQQTVR